MNLDNPRFSVIICTYKRARHDRIQRAVRSVFAQTFPNWELLVINDGDRESAEDYRRLLKPFGHDPRFRSSANGGYFEMPSNRGLPTVRNVGISLAKGDYVCFLDDDDRYHQRALQRFWETVQRHDYPDLVYGEALQEHLGQSQGWPFPTGSGTPWRSPFDAKRLKRENFILASSVALKHKTLREVGPFWEELWQGDRRGPEDWEMWQRLASLGKRIVGIPYVVVFRRADFSEEEWDVPMSLRVDRLGTKAEGDNMVRDRYAWWRPQ